MAAGCKEKLMLLYFVMAAQASYIRISLMLWTTLEKRYF